MFKLTIPGTDVPNWLIPGEVEPGGSRCIKFTNINLIYRKAGIYHMTPLLPNRPVITLKGSHHCTIDTSKLYIHPNPIHELISWVKRKVSKWYPN